MRHADVQPRASGPDLRVHMDGTSVVCDVSIVSPDAPSFIGKGPDAAMNARVADKIRKYGKAVAAKGEELVVLGATCYGTLSKDTRAFIKRVALASNGAVDERELRAEVSCAVTLLNGHVLFAAERRAGVVHESAWSSVVSEMSSQAPSTTQSRDESGVSME
jgi:hypothetical protein